MSSSLTPTNARPAPRFRRLIAATIALAVGIAIAVTSGAPASAAWEDSGTAQARAQALLARMTLDEKIDMLHGEINGLYGFYNAPIPRLGIPALTMADGPAGTRVANQDVNDGESTALPAPIALAATWNGSLAKRFGSLAGSEAFRTGHNVLLSPAADIFRDPRAGRGFEAFGEDPLLSGTMAAQQILGIQSNPVLADIKHLAAYNQETNRLLGGNAVVSERAYQEVYLRPIGQAVAQGHPASAMCAFNKINGVWACENKELLTTILRDQMHFAGFVMSDYNATHTTQLAFDAGLDQEQPENFHFGQALLDLVNDGTIPVSEIGARVLRILTPMYALGLFDKPVVTTGFNEAANARVAQSIAEQSMVLLKNDGALPLSVRNIDDIAVIGADADTDVAGGGSSLVKGTRVVSPLEGIQARVGPSVDVDYSQGTDPIGNGGALLPGPEPVPSDVLTTADGSESGLTAQYWTNNTRTGDPGITRVEPFAAQFLGFVGFEAFNASSPKLPETPRDYFGSMSATWNGTLTVPTTGKYTFSIGAEGSGTLYFDDQPVATVDKATSYSTKTWDVNLTAGDTHTVRIEYAHDIPTQQDAGPQVKFGWIPPRGFVAEKARAAATLAAQSDVAVVFVRDLSSEGPDKPSLNLPQGQAALVRAVTRANPNTIVVATTGGAMEMDSWDNDVAGVLQAWYGGQRQGSAIARILFGDVNPSGHLPVTFPFSEDETPTSTEAQFPGIGLDAQYSEGINVGYKGYIDQDIDVKYPFGYGLSYTKFRTTVTGLPTSPRVTSSGQIDPGQLEVKVRVANTGKRAGAEVVQVYAGKLPGAVETPQRELAGWAKVSVARGDTETATITLDPKSLAYWNTATNKWTTPKGVVKLYVGNSVESAKEAGSITVR
ncbi:glycoside hydrolase family 3 protein [Glaciihabitans sp. dw_435]|uniref:glycoside hydrolase family 3 protein n=1 Tax=Glaciihabitans sp. dw_435 TaxID=2720081 RepID=UPI001BD59149|nr:glycoside hydrolase family 3 C-terminal domain-containing protein [Glaciihabitans sp. dw_435]